MKEFAYKVLLILSLLTLLAGGFDFLFSATEFTHYFVGAWPGLQGAEPLWLRYGIAGAGILLPILTAVTGLLCVRDNSIGTRTANGVIRLSPKAIEKLVKREVRQNVEEVLDVSATARQGKRNAPAVQVHVALTDTAPVPQVEARVKRETERVLKHLLGVADTNQIRVVVHDVSAVPARKRRQKERVPKKPANPADRSAIVPKKPATGRPE